MTESPPSEPLVSRVAARVRGVTGVRRVLLIVGVVVVVLVCAGLGTIAVLDATVFSPQVTARAYLDRIAAGDIAGANALRPPGVTSPLFVADALSSRADRISHVAVGSATRSGSSATVSYSYRLRGSAYRSSLKLTTAAGRPFVDDWRVSSTALGRLELFAVGPQTLKVNGIVVALPSDKKLTVAAYPGVYRVSVAYPKWLDASARTVAVEATRSGVVLVTSTPTAAVTAEVDAQVRAIVDRCATTTAAVTPGCPFSLSTLGTVARLTWTIERYPTVEISPDGSMYSMTDGDVIADYDIVADGTVTYSHPFHEHLDFGFDAFGPILLSADGVRLKVEE